MAVLIIASYAISELNWTLKEQKQESLRRIIGLPSIAVGNLSPAERNPGLEMICTGLNDQPGGYCYYYTSGVPFEDYQYFPNITLSGIDK
jgi:hypothetical protein